MKAKIEVFFSPACPYCPKARQLVSEVASRYGDAVELDEVNTWTKEGMERGMAYRLQAVSTVAIDGVIKFVGFPFAESDLVESIEVALHRK